MEPKNVVCLLESLAVLGRHRVQVDVENGQPIQTSFRLLEPHVSNLDSGVGDVEFREGIAFHLNRGFVVSIPAFLKKQLREAGANTPLTCHQQRRVIAVVIRT